MTALNHEIRDVSGGIIGASILLGTIDGLAPSDGVKLFGWLFVMVGLTVLIIYELLNLDAEVYEVLPPAKTSALLVGEMVGAFWGVWNVVYLGWKALEGSPQFVGGSIGIAPNIAVSEPAWVITTFLALILTSATAIEVNRLVAIPKTS